MTPPLVQPRPGILTLPWLDADACAEVIGYAQERQQWHPAGVTNAEGTTHVKEAVRTAALHFFEATAPVTRMLHERLHGLVRPVVRPCYGRDFTHYEAFQLVRYDPGGFFSVHRDSGPHLAHRYVTVVGYLNDDFAGGGTHFPDADFTAQPALGQALLFPSDYRHQGQPVQTGTKYVLVTWLTAPPPPRWI